MATQGLTQHPESPDLHNAYGLLLAAEDKVPEALEETEKALALRSTFLDAQINRAILLKRLGRYPDSIAQFQAVLNANPANLKARANLGGTLLLAKRYEEAAAALREAVTQAPDDFDLHANLGLALQKSGHAAEAQKEFALAEKLRGPEKKQ